MAKKGVEAAPSILKRILAFIIDLLVLNLIVLYPFRGLIENLIPSGSLSDSYNYLMAHPGNVSAIYAVMIMAAILAVLYFSLMEYKLGQTVGKIIFKLKAVPLKKKLGYWQCVLRAMLVIPFFPFYILWIADPVFALLNKDQQRLMEWVSKTKTVQSYDLKGWKQ